MQITCPCCHARFPLDAAVADADARAALAVALSMPDRIPDLVTYLGLFRPAGQVLRWSRVGRLLADLTEVIQAGSIRRRGRDWTVPADVWPGAIAAVIERRDRGHLATPLRDHAYLYEVAIGLAEKRAGEEEVRRDEERRGRPRTDATTPEEPERIDPERTLQHINRARAAIGLRPHEGGSS